MYRIIFTKKKIHYDSFMKKSVHILKNKSINLSNQNLTILVNHSLIMMTRICNRLRQSILGITKKTCDFFN